MNTRKNICFDARKLLFMAGLDVVVMKTIKQKQFS